MYFRFTPLARFVIIISFTLTASLFLVHLYNLHRIVESNKLIFQKMKERNVLRETAIVYLENEGFELVTSGEFATFIGVSTSIPALICLYFYARDNSFFFAMSASFFCLTSTFLCGILLFYLIFSGKSEDSTIRGKRKFNSQWEEFINSKSK